jgi:hypothetical protein
MRRELEMITLAMILSLPVAVTASADMQPQKGSESSQGAQGAIVPETPQQQQEKQRQIDRSNLEQQQPGQASQPDPNLPRAGQASPQPGSPSPEIGGKESGFPNPEFPTVRGEILTIQGEFYTVQDSKGNEIRLHVNRDTKMEGDFKIGDTVEVQRTVSGHAKSIKKASAEGTSAQPSKPGRPDRQDAPGGGGGSAGTGGRDVFGESGSGQGSGGGAGTQSPAK